MAASTTMDPAKPLPNARYEIVAQEVSQGKRWAEAMALAGYGSRTNATRLKKNQAIVERVAWLRERAGASVGVDRARILAHLLEQVDWDAGELIDNPGEEVPRMKPIDQLPAHIRRCIQGVKVVKQEGEWGSQTILEYRFTDRQKAMDQLCRILGLFEKDNRQKAEGVFVIAGPPGAGDGKGAPSLEEWMAAAKRLADERAQEG